MSHVDAVTGVCLFILEHVDDGNSGTSRQFYLDESKAWERYYELKELDLGGVSLYQTAADDTTLPWAELHMIGTTTPYGHNETSEISVKTPKQAADYTEDTLDYKGDNPHICAAALLTVARAHDCSEALIGLVQDEVRRRAEGE